jgi:hypothetical protein
MKQFYMGSYPCYEFQAELSLVDEVSEYVKTIEYGPIGQPVDVSQAVSSGRAPGTNIGYIIENNQHKSFYHEGLYNYFQNCVDQVAKKHFTKFDLKISDLWSTRTKFGMQAGSHKHELSVFSGLLYLTDTNKSQTVFTIPDMFYDTWSHFISSDMIRQNQEIKITAEKGKLIIWPSMLQHKIHVHTEQSTRYTIAFNTMFSGANVMPTARLKLSVERPDNNFL